MFSFLFSIIKFMNIFSKLNNSLIRIKSLKVLSLIGLIFIVIMFYLDLISFKQALEVNKQTGCIPDAGLQLCATDYVESRMIGIIILFSFLTPVFTFFAMLEVLFLKFIKKDKKEVSYHIGWSILFWIGILPAIAVNLFWIWCIIFEYIMPIVDFIKRPDYQKLSIYLPAILFICTVSVIADYLIKLLIKKLNNSAK